MLPETLIEPRVASPLVIIEALMFIVPPDTSSIVFVFIAAEPVVAIFPDELIPPEPTVNELEIFTSAGKLLTLYLLFELQPQPRLLYL